MPAVCDSQTFELAAEHRQKERNCGADSACQPPTSSSWPFLGSFLSQPLSSSRTVLPNRVLNPAPLARTPFASRPPHLIFWREGLWRPSLSSSRTPFWRSQHRPPQQRRTRPARRSLRELLIWGLFFKKSWVLFVAARLPHPLPWPPSPTATCPGSAGQTLNPGHASP